MSSDAAILAVYDPPKPELPYLAVVIYPDGTVHGVVAEDAASAQAIVDGLAEKAGLTN